MPLSSVFAEIEMAVVFERANVAVSADPLGTVAGLQFVLVFQSPERGLRFHVALPASLAWMQSIKINALKIPVILVGRFMRGFFFLFSRLVSRWNCNLERSRDYR